MYRGRNQVMVYMALLVAQAVVIGILERYIPTPFVFAPGAKLGLANLVTILALFTLPVKQSFQVVALRTVVTLLVGGTLSTFMYSVAGALLSYGAMLMLMRLGSSKVSIIGVSTFGGLVHNVGQLCVASLLSQSWQVLNYLPVLSLSGILAGFAVGVAGYLLLQQNKKLHYYHTALMESVEQSSWLSPLAKEAVDE